MKRRLKKNKETALNFMSKDTDFNYDFSITFNVFLPEINYILMLKAVKFMSLNMKFVMNLA